MKHLPAVATLSLIGLVGAPVLAQSRQDRVDHIAGLLAGATQQDNRVFTDTASGQAGATPRQLLRETLTETDYKATPVKLALEIWSDQTRVPLVINWEAMANAGVSPDTPITLRLNRVPAEVVLRLIVQQMQPEAFGDDELILDIQPWYVRVMTKREALRRSVTKVYFIGDLLMTVPNFDNAPGFNLSDALSNTNSGGSGGNGGGQQELFRVDEADDERAVSKAERAEQIAQTIRDSIEPDIWRANGGEYASVRYLRGMLVVKAPAFVHEQIGIPSSGSSTKTNSRSSRESRHRSGRGAQLTASGNVSGIAPEGPKTTR